jgi:hypothetical protein
MQPSDVWTSELSTSIRWFTAILLVAAISCFSFVLEGVSDTGMSSLQVIVLLYGVLVVLAVWLIYLCVFFGFVKNRRFHHLLLLVLVPGLMMGTWFLGQSDWTPLIWRLRLSEQDLRATDQQTWDNGRLVGLFVVHEKQLVDNELRFATSQCHFLDRCGVIYSPDGSPRRIGEDSFRHLFGHWWHWRDSW